jgi:hypothetical protein
MKQARLKVAAKTFLKKSGAAVAGISALLILAPMAFATPSTTFWTPMVEDIQPFGVAHLGIDNYFRTKSTGVLPTGGPVDQFATDFTMPTIGVLPFKKLQMEVGVDYFATFRHPWFFNAKFGSPEGSFAKWQPALEIGVYDLGVNFDNYFPRNPGGAPRADYDILYGVIGKTIPKIGRFSAGPYIGNRAAFVSQALAAGESAGVADNVGFMLAFDHALCPVKDKDGSVIYSRVVLAADYESGYNAIGATGGGVYYYFTPDISLLVGPTVFNDSNINGRWKITSQLDINLPKISFRHAKAAPAPAMPATPAI